MKKQKQNESIYYMNEYEKLFLKFPYIFLKIIIVKIYENLL